MASDIARRAKTDSEAILAVRIRVIQIRLLLRPRRVFLSIEADFYWALDIGHRSSTSCSPRLNQIVARVDDHEQGTRLNWLIDGPNVVKVGRCRCRLASGRDGKVIAFADENGLVLVFSGERFFRHLGGLAR